MKVYAVDHGSPQRTGSTTVYVLVEGSQRPVFDNYHYTFYVRDSQYFFHYCRFCLVIQYRGGGRPDCSHETYDQNSL